MLPRASSAWGCRFMTLHRFFYGSTVDTVHTTVFGGILSRISATSLLLAANAASPRLLGFFWLLLVPNAVLVCVFLRLLSRRLRWTWLQYDSTCFSLSLYFYCFGLLLCFCIPWYVWFNSRHSSDVSLRRLLFEQDS